MFPMLAGAMSDIDIIRQNSSSFAIFVKEFFKEYGNRVKKSSQTIKWLKSLYTARPIDMDRVFQKGRQVSRLKDEGKITESNEEGHKKILQRIEENKKRKLAETHRGLGGA